MAAGLPCMIVNNGGVAEYVTEKTGFKIEPTCRDEVVSQMAKKIDYIVTNQDSLDALSMQSLARARDFVWHRKAKDIFAIYNKLKSHN
jgi:alpha-maltose-1-phosphate synthase